jgi:hypothetical protein
MLFAPVQDLVGKSGDAQEGELLSYLADFKSSLQVMTTVKLLSSHADDEHTLNEPNAMLTVSRAGAHTHMGGCTHACMRDHDR